MIFHLRNHLPKRKKFLRNLPDPKFNPGENEISLKLQECQVKNILPQGLEGSLIRGKQAQLLHAQLMEANLLQKQWLKTQQSMGWSVLRNLINQKDKILEAKKDMSPIAEKCPMKLSKLNQHTT